MPEDFRALTDDELYDKMSSLRTGLKSSPVPLEQIKQTPLGMEVRRRAKQDLYFLSKYFIGFENKKNDLIVEITHRRVCNLFIKKDDSKPLAEQDWRKDRLLLYPRGGFKSTIDVHDVVQWILNFPNIRILFLTATDELATGFADQTRKAFIILEEQPSFMNLFFPEFCVLEKTLKADFEFTTPMRTIHDFKEPTVTASSLGSTKSGFHYELMKADDAVSDINSENEDQCRKVTKVLSLKRKMLMAYGYFDKIGTRYHELDAYGDTLIKNIGNIRKTSDHPCCELIENLDTGLIILIGRAIVVKPEFAGKTCQEAGKDGCFLLFPTYLTYEFLMKERYENESVYEGQYNQNPRAAGMITFTKDLLVAHTVPFNKLPLNGPISITWDFAFVAKKGRDYCTASVGIYNDKGQLFIIDLVRQRFKMADLAKAVVELAIKWHPVIIGIENAGGSQALEPAILMEAGKIGVPADVLSVCQHIDWFSVDTQLDAKRHRMGALHPLLTNDMLYFVSHLPYLEVLYDEFEVCMMMNHKHDDIPDVISQQPKYAPRINVLMQKGELQTMSREQAEWNILFGEGDAFGRTGMGYNPPVAMAVEPQDLPSETPSSDLDPILGSGFFG